MCLYFETVIKIKDLDQNNSQGLTEKLLLSGNQEFIYLST